MNRGVPPTALNARTGEFTPPGVTRWARWNQSADSPVAGAFAGEVEAAGGGWEERTVPGTLAFSPTVHNRGNRPPSRRNLEKA